jgi:hypothetical protein
LGTIAVWRPEALTWRNGSGQDVTDARIEAVGAGSIAAALPWINAR